MTNETAFINDIGSLARVWWPEAEPHWGLMADWPASGISGRLEMD